MAKLALGIAIIALVLGGVANFKSPAPTTDGTELGGLTENQKKTFAEGYFLGPNRIIDFQRDGDIISAATATTTLDMNFLCIQVNPTSTATNVKIRATTTATGIALGSAFFSSYGTCP